MEACYLSAVRIVDMECATFPGIIGDPPSSCLNHSHVEDVCNPVGIIVDRPRPVQVSF